MQYRLKLRGENATGDDPWEYVVTSTAYPDAFVQNTADAYQLDITVGPALEELGVPFADYQGGLDFSEDGETWYSHLYSEPDVVDTAQQVWLIVRVTQGKTQPTP